MYAPTPVSLKVVHYTKMRHRNLGPKNLDFMLCRTRPASSVSSLPLVQLPFDFLAPP